MSDIKKLLGKLLEEQSITEEQAATNINTASKKALKSNAGTTTTSDLKASVANDPVSEIERHLLSAYNIIKQNPQLKLGPVTSIIKKHFDSKEKNTSVPVRGTSPAPTTTPIPPTPIPGGK